MNLRAADEHDSDSIWTIMEPVIRAGETWALPRDWTKEQALDYWFAFPHLYVAEKDGEVLGTFYLRPNQMGGGAHIANGGYMVAQNAQGRGIATAMGEHSLKEAKRLGFKAMQFNFVVSTNERAVQLWQRLGFEIAARLSQGFHHPTRGFVDVLVMYRLL